jgi:Domain of unknown function (DUF4234)
MATHVAIDGGVYKKRRPTVVWLLTLVTLLVYFFIWYYRVNDDARRYLHDDSIRPWVSVLAIFPGVLLIVPYFVSIYRTAQRIERIEERAGSPKRVRPVLGPMFAFLTMLTFFLMGGCLYYYQDHLNAAWAAAAESKSVENLVPPARASRQVAR